MTLIRLFLVAAGLVGSYFVTPVLANKLYSVAEVPVLMKGLSISVGSVNAVIFFAFFMLTYGFTAIVCSIARHCFIKKLQDKRLNKAKIKRARSINPRAEKAVVKAEWKALTAKYSEKRKWYHRVISCCLGAIIGLVMGVAILLPYNYIAKDVAKATNKEYLVNGFDYTLNGVIGEEVFDWVISAAEELPSSDEIVESAE